MTPQEFLSSIYDFRYQNSSELIKLGVDLKDINTIANIYNSYQTRVRLDRIDHVLNKIYEETIDPSFLLSQQHPLVKDIKNIASATSNTSDLLENLIELTSEK